MHVKFYLFSISRNNTHLLHYYREKNNIVFVYVYFFMLLMVQSVLLLRADFSGKFGPHRGFLTHQAFQICAKASICTKQVNEAKERI